MSTPPLDPPPTSQTFSPVTFPSLDQLLTEEATRPDRAGMVAGNYAEGWATPGRVADFRAAAAEHEVTIDGLLGALATLYGPACTVVVREHIGHLEGTVHHLADIAAEAFAQTRSADAVAAANRDDARSARATAVRLEGALSAADERVARVRNVLGELLTYGVDGDEGTTVTEALERVADRLRTALAFDAFADPATLDPTPQDIPLPPATLDPREF